MEKELNEIKEIRKKSGLTQIQLAHKSGVSQSLIAKIEAGKLDPTYTNAKKIFKALDELTKQNEAKAKDIMNTKLVYVDPKDDMNTVIKKMNKYEISQLPVVDEEKIVGYISEAMILSAIGNGKKDFKAKDVMEESVPTVSGNAITTVISDLLKHYPMVLVMEQGKIQGVITKSDIIRNVFK
jgi:predicted transcriptional regulator